MELEGADGFRIAAYRRAAARILETGSSVAQLALDGRAKELQGIGKTIEEKIVEVVEDGEIHALTKRKAEVPVGGRVASCACPGSARRRRGGSGRSSGSRRSTELRAAAEAQRLRDLGGLGAEVGGEDPRRARRSRAPSRGPSARCSARCCRGCARSRRTLAAHPAAVRVSIAGSARRYRETVRDLDLIATATDAPALIDAFCEAAVGRRGRRAGRHEGDRGRPGRPSLRPPRRPARVLREPAAALHRLEGPQRRAARGGGPPGPLGLGVRDRRGRERRRCMPSRPRRRSTASSATTWIPPELRENCGELDAARNGSLPDLVELARPARRPAHAHDLVGREGHRSRRWSPRRSRRGYDYYAICDHSHRLRDGRLEQQAEAIDRARTRSSRIQLLKGVEVNIRVERRARRRRRGSRDARLGGRLGAQQLRHAIRPAASSRRWRTRTSTASAI